MQTIQDAVANASGASGLLSASTISTTLKTAASRSECLRIVEVVKHWHTIETAFKAAPSCKDLAD